MLKIRLQRVGRRNDPAYRLVVVESRQGIKSKKAIEQVGFYNPKTKERSFKAERITHWIESGAQASDTVYNMLISEGIISGEKRNALPKKRPIVSEKTEEEKSAAAPSAQKEEPATETSEATPEQGEEEGKEEAPASEEVAEEEKKPEAAEEKEEATADAPVEEESKESE